MKTIDLTDEQLTKLDNGMDISIDNPILGRVLIRSPRALTNPEPQLAIVGGHDALGIAGYDDGDWSYGTNTGKEGH